MKGDSPGVYHTKPVGRWPFKYRAVATEGNYQDEDAEWTIKLERYSRLEDRWLTKAAFKLYPEAISKVKEIREVNRCWKDREKADSQSASSSNEEASA